MSSSRTLSATFQVPDSNFYLHHNKRVVHRIDRHETSGGITRHAVRADTFDHWAVADMPRFNAKKLAEFHETFMSDLSNSMPSLITWASEQSPK